MAPLEGRRATFVNDAEAFLVEKPLSQGCDKRDWRNKITPVSVLALRAPFGGAPREVFLMVTRRFLLAGVAAALAASNLLGRAGRAFAAQTFEVTHTEEEWRKMLSADQYAVLRQAGTERPFTSPLLNEHRKGVFSCAGCDRDLFSSTTKFESGTGWPSFWAPLDNAVATEEDKSYGMSRTAVNCSRCGGHLGHVFDDGPKPTGLRYCMNGLAMTFKPATA
jgi:peptide-methionine (R)-S-oxide reductase